jgi:hypothetical protein
MSLKRSPQKKKKQKESCFFLLHSKLDTCFPFAFALHLGCCAQTIVVRHRRPPASTHKTDLLAHRLQFGPFLVSFRHSQSLILLSKKNDQHKTGNHENKQNKRKVLQTFAERVPASIVMTSFGKTTPAGVWGLNRDKMRIITEELDQKEAASYLFFFLDYFSRL